MNELVTLFGTGSALFGARVHAVGAEQWASSTPCTEWDVTALVDHLIDEHLWAPPLLAGMDLAAAQQVVDAAKDGGDRVAAWDAAAAASQKAVAEPGAVDRQVNLSRGTTSAGEYLTEMIADLTLHSWDLGRAIGVDEPLPPELVRFSLPLAQRYAGAEPYFGPPVELPDGASEQDRLIATSGRSPR
jgi:uncharacterized protein (TIGR03086 family)